MIDKALFISASSLAECLESEKKKADMESDDKESLFLRSLIPRMKKLPNVVMSNIRFQIEKVFQAFVEKITTGVAFHNPRNLKACGGVLSVFRHFFSMPAKFAAAKGNCRRNCLRDY